MEKTMHARLTTRQIEPDRIDEAIGIYRDTVVPAVSQRQGSKCGVDTTVPFVPRDDRPVYCSDCFSEMKS